MDRVHRGLAEIAGPDAHHLTRVLRVEAGQHFEISDNERAWLAEVETARKDQVRFRVIEEIAAGPALPAVTLYLALIRFERFEWAVEKATELGVTRIAPVDAARTERGLFEGAHKRVERWQRIAREASEQSRRLRMPEVTNPMRLAEALGDASAHRCWLDEQPGAPPLMRAFSPGENDSSALLIGPEGGWTEGERAECTRTGWIGASLGPTILRAETAACAALAVVAQMWAARASTGGQQGEKMTLKRGSDDD